MPEPDALRAVLARAREQVAQLGAALCAAGEPVPAQAADAWPSHSEHPDLITPAAAAAREGVDGSTIRRWAREAGIGRRYGTRWRISLKRMRAHLTETSEP